jgi:SAM-dependent methyltransferase
MTDEFFGSLPAYSFTPEKKLSDLNTLELSIELLAHLKGYNDNSSENFDNRLFLAVCSDLEKELERSLNVFENRFSLKYLEGLFYVTYRFWENHKLPIKEATYVDVGCGSVNPYGLSFMYLMLGAHRGICIDLDPAQNLPQSLINLAKIAGKTIINPSKVFCDFNITSQEIIDNIAEFDLTALSNGFLSNQDSKRLNLRQESIFQTSLEDGEADVVISISFLEHISDIDLAVAELARITKSGGYGVHNIDGLDHMIYSDSGIHPLEFLRIDTTDKIVHVSNRIRPMSFIEIFDRHGFDILEINKYGNLSIDQQLRKSFAEPFRSMPQEYLELTQACFLVRKR